MVIHVVVLYHKYYDFFTASQVECHNCGVQQLVNEPTLQEMDKFIQQISWGNRRLLSVVLLWKQYKGLGQIAKNSRTC